jgi:GTP cyclohydrolase III
MNEWVISTQDIITLAAIIGAITVVWNFGKKPFDAIKKISTDVESIGSKVDKIQQDQQKQGDMVYQLLSHAATNNNTGEMRRALDEYNEYFRH